MHLNSSIQHFASLSPLKRVINYSSASNGAVIIL